MFKIAFRLALSLVLLLGIGIALVSDHGLAAIRGSLSEVTPSALLIAGVALFASTLLAAARVKLVGADLGYDLSWRDALAALGLGQIGGAVFFSIAGQLLARGAYLSARGQPIGATVVMVGYERALAGFVSLALAAAGALYVFGQIGLDLTTGGASLLKILGGVALATAAGAWLGWGTRLLVGLKHLGGAPIIRRFSLNLALSLAIQLATMAAYIAIARGVAPDVKLAQLAAASAVVMLAASLPISFGGWGIRELGAVLVLGAVGVSPAAALVTAILIGLGSLLVVAPLAAMALVRPPAQMAPIAVNWVWTNYTALLALVVPLAAATLVFFNVRVPTETGGLTVNLADPFAVLGGALSSSSPSSSVNGLRGACPESLSMPGSRPRRLLYRS